MQGDKGPNYLMCGGRIDPFLLEATVAHPQSRKIINPPLQVFQVPPTDTSTNGYGMVTIYLKQKV